MADSNPMHRGSCDLSSPEAEDRITQQAVLINLLAEHPTPLTLDEMILVLNADPSAAIQAEPGRTPFANWSPLASFTATASSSR